MTALRVAFSCDSFPSLAPLSLPFDFAHEQPMPATGVVRAGLGDAIASDWSGKGAPDQNGATRLLARDFCFDRARG